MGQGSKRNFCFNLIYRGRSGGRSEICCNNFHCGEISGIQVGHANQGTAIIGMILTIKLKWNFVVSCQFSCHLQEEEVVAIIIIIVLQALCPLNIKTFAF